MTENERRRDWIEKRPDWLGSTWPKRNKAPNLRRLMNNEDLYKDIPRFQPIIAICREWKDSFYSPWQLPSGEKLFISFSSPTNQTNHDGSEINVFAFRVGEGNTYSGVYHLKLQVSRHAELTLADKLKNKKLEVFMLEEAVMRLKRSIIFNKPVDKKLTRIEKILNENVKDCLTYGGENNFRDKLANYEVHVAEKGTLEAIFSLENQGIQMPSGHKIYNEIWCSLDTYCTALRFLKEQDLIKGTFVQPINVLGYRFGLTSLGVQFCRNKEQFEKKYPSASVLASKLMQTVPVASDLDKLCSEDEGQCLERKSSSFYDYEKQCNNISLFDAVIKTVAGFMNKEGGCLVIGVDDQGNVLGLDKDYETLKGRKNADGYQQRVNQLLLDKLGKEFSDSFRVSIERYKDKEICIIQVKKSNMPCTVKNNILYVRVGNSTKPYEGNDAYLYIAKHWRNH